LDNVPVYDHLEARTETQKK